MNTHNILKVATFVLVVGTAGVLLSGCQHGAQPTSTPGVSTTGGTDASHPAANAVTIQNMAFAPQNVQVKVGQTVTWTNQDQVAHTVTSDTKAFDSGTVANGGTYAFTFSKAGTYPYHCNIHPSMTAQVTVTE